MTGFFARMGERAIGREPALMPRQPMPFEAAPSALDDLLVEEAEVVAPPVAPPADRDPGDALAERRERPAPADVPPARRAREPVPATLAPPAASLVAPAAPPIAEARPPEPSATRRAPLAEPPARTATRADPPATAPPRSPPDPDPPARPSGERETARPLQSPAPRQRRRRRAAPRPEPPHVRDLGFLLREHVMPALVDRGVVRRDERAVLAEPSVASRAAGQDAPGPGTVTVRATPLATPAPEPADDRPVRRSEPAVHLHIDRVVVTRAPAPAPPAPPAPRPPRRTVDHAEYLARRRERP